MGREREIQRRCDSCGSPHAGPSSELLEGAYCRLCKHFFRPVTRPYPVDGKNLEAIARSLPIPLLVEIQIPGSRDEVEQKPALEKVAKTVDGKALVLKLNADEDRETCWRLGVQTAPTLLVLKRGEVLHAYEGVADAELIEEWLRLASRQM